MDAIGHQWWWEFRYPEYGVVTANELHLPVGRPIDVRLRSADVIHSFWVPRFGGKRYNMPIRHGSGRGRGRRSTTSCIFTIEQPGEYSGQCAEFCGTSHALMRMQVVAEEQAEFEAWVAKMKDGRVGSRRRGRAGHPARRPGPARSLEAEGYQVFMRAGCAACHAINGTPAMGVLGPNLTRIGSRWSIGAGLMENTPENIARWIRNAPGLKPDAKMLTFPNLSDADMEALVAYLHSLD